MRLLLLFFFNDTATTEIYTLSLHDALPICRRAAAHPPGRHCIPRHRRLRLVERRVEAPQDRKSTRLNSSHSQISYAVFCLKKKKLHLPPPGPPLIIVQLRGSFALLGTTRPL